MTQAFNLAQFANNVNSAGKAAAGTSLTGTVPVANGGTNLATIPTNGQLLIGNGTSYALAALSAGSNITITNGAGTITIDANVTLTTANVMNAVAGQTYNGVGTIGFFACSNTSYVYPSQTMVGTKLFYISTNNSSITGGSMAGYIIANGDRRNATTTFTAQWPGLGVGNNTYTSVGSGTWRNISHNVLITVYDSCAAASTMQLGLWLRTA